MVKEFRHEEGIVFYGAAKDIKAIEKSFNRAGRKGVASFSRPFCDVDNAPRFNEVRMYGLLITWEGVMWVLTADTTLKMMFDE